LTALLMIWRKLVGIVGSLSFCYGPKPIPVSSIAINTKGYIAIVPGYDFRNSPGRPGEE
jgi:hypothetical protein